MQARPNNRPALEPSADYCFGRDDLCERLIRTQREEGSAFLFGGPLAGKTTVLLRVECELAQEAGFVDVPSHLVIPVYCDLRAMSRDATPGDFFCLLSCLARQACGRQIGGFPKAALPSEPKPSAHHVQAFADEATALFDAAREVHVQLFFLLDHCKRITGERFPRGFQDNLVSLLWGRRLGVEGRIAMVFAGSQDLYETILDRETDLVTRSSKIILSNLPLEMIIQMVKKSPGLAARYDPEELSVWLCSYSGGHPGLSRLILHRLEGADTAAKSLRDQIARDCVQERQELLACWHREFSEEAICIHDRLSKVDGLSQAAAARLLTESGLDMSRAPRAFEELTFTGVAAVENRTIHRSGTIYWDFVSHFSDDGSLCPAEVGADPSDANGISQKRITGPFQLDWVRDALLDGTGRWQEPVPLPYVLVLKELLTPDPVNKAFRGSVSYEDAALKFEEGRIRRDTPRASKEDIGLRFQNRLAKHSGDLKPLAQDFARDFRRWLRKKHIVPNDIIRCDEQLGRYCLGDNWHRNDPVLNRSSVGPRTNLTAETEDLSDSASDAVVD